MLVKIISEKEDISTNNVIEWFISKKTNFKRYNYYEFTEKTIHITNDYNEIHKENIWHRRYHQSFTPISLFESIFKNFLVNEELKFVKFKEYIQKNDFYFGSIKDEVEHNKLIDLTDAKTFGLKIPETIVTNQKKDLIKFYTKYKRIITKPISDNLRVNENNFIYISPGTILIDNKDISSLSSEFAISIFQEYVEKKFEIRIFYFKKKFFSMAIFSQNDDKTSIDYRNYNYDKPNRVIPYKLPKLIQQKLLKLLTVKKISTCSIDMILNNYDEFVFLEINPQGQYDWLSKNCNYYIDKYISNVLSYE